MPMHVFRHHHGIVHQEPNANHQPHDRQAVERFSREIQGRKGDQQAKRNGHGDHKREAELPEKKIEHHRGQQSTQLAIANQV